jgi:hypothetical protein
VPASSDHQTSHAQALAWSRGGVDLQLLEDRTLNGRTRELIHRPTRY